MAGGRPTDYDPAYCETVIELGKQGKSKVQMAAHFDVCRKTIDNWADQHPEFLRALTRAMTHAQDWWETAGQVGMVADKFNSSVWSRSMAARFPEDWQEKKEFKHSGAIARDMSDEDLDARLEALLRARS